MGGSWQVMECCNAPWFNKETFWKICDASLWRHDESKHITSQMWQGWVFHTMMCGRWWIHNFPILNLDSKLEIRQLTLHINKNLKAVSSTFYHTSSIEKEREKCRIVWEEKLEREIKKGKRERDNPRRNEWKIFNCVQQVLFETTWNVRRFLWDKRTCLVY